MVLLHGAGREIGAISNLNRNGRAMTVSLFFLQPYLSIGDILLLLGGLIVGSFIVRAVLRRLT